MCKQLSVVALVICALFVSSARAQVLIGGSLNNGNLDRSHATEVVPGFFLPKPNVWIYTGTRTLTGPYGDGLSSEPWAGPAPTPVTTDNLLNPPFPDGAGDTNVDGDAGIFFKPFTGGGTDGPATISLYQDHVVAGCLLSYGQDVAQFHRRAALYVDRIFRGAKPEDLPVEQPTKFNLVVNSKTAAALGLAVPQTLLVTADRVIE